MVRMAMGLAGLVPLPADALVTPVTFRVRRRNLREILAPLDAKETEMRELSGEWVVGKKLWQTLQSDYRSSHQPPHKNAVLEDSLKGGSSSFRKSHSRVILYVHGGESLIHSEKYVFIVLPRCLLLFECRFSEDDNDTDVEIHRDSRIWLVISGTDLTSRLIYVSDRLSSCTGDLFSRPSTRHS